MRWNDPLPEPNPSPLWFQIFERLRLAIAEGAFTPGDLLPSESQLNKVFGVSRSTSRTALDRLRQDGLITRRSGRGSIVVVPKVDQPATEMSGFAQDMRRRGLKASYLTRYAGFATASSEATEALELPAKSRLFMSRRLLKADDAPIGFAVSWLAPCLFETVTPPSAKVLSSDSLYDWLARNCGVQIIGRIEYIEAAIVEPDMAIELGQAQGSAILIARRVSRDASERLIEYAVLYFRPDRYRFLVNASANGGGKSAC